MHSPSKNHPQTGSQPEGTIKSNEESLYKKIADRNEEFLSKLNWEKQVANKFPTLLSNYKLRIDDDINIEFQDVFQKIILSLEKEVCQVIQAKTLELENALKGLKSNEHSSNNLTNRTVPEDSKQPRTRARSQNRASIG